MSNKLSVKDRAMLASQVAPQAPVANPSAENMPQASIKTGPGSLVAFMSKESEVFKENQQLKDKLLSWSDAKPVRKLDCSTVHPSKWANRSELSYQSSEFAELKADIESSEGNVQAIKVRPLDSKPGEYEIIFGHRRHRACSMLGLPVLASIEEVSDAELFVQMDRENRQRADLRPFEQGVMYARALDEGLYGSMRKLSEVLGVPLSSVSQYVALARLPNIVLSAFGSPHVLMQAWAGPLTKAVEQDPELVFSVAQAFVGQTPPAKSTEIFKRLTGVCSTNTQDKICISVEGENGRSGKINFNSKRKMVSITLQNVDASQLKALEAAIKSFLT